MSLSFKYWVEFDDVGGIKSLHKSKYGCPNPCKEYIVKLIPIKREFTDKAEKLSKELESSANRLKTKMKRFDTELDKTIRTMKRIKLN